MSVSSPCGGTLPAPCVPRPREAGTSPSSSALPMLRTNRQGLWSDKAPVLQGFGSAGARLYSTYNIKGTPVRAVFSEMGTRNYDLDPTDRWIRFDVYMQRRLAFELIQGHPLIADSFNAMMWDNKSQKVLENMLWLDHSNCLHNVSIAASFVPENILVAENSSSVRLINPDGHKIDGVTHFSSDGMCAAVHLYFAEAKKNQPTVLFPMDVKEYCGKVQNLNKVMLTREQAEDYLYDAAFLDEAGLTATLHQSSFLLRGCYVSSNVQEDIDARIDALLALQKSLCRDGVSNFLSYLKTGHVPITLHFHNETVLRSQNHINRFMLAPPQERPILLLIQDGHNQLGAQRNTMEHLNERKNLQQFQGVITPQPNQVINPTSQQHVINPQQSLSTPLQKQQQVVLSTLQHNPMLPELNTVPANCISKYHHFHCPLTAGVIFESMRKEEKSRKDMNIPGLFASDRKPST